MNIKELAKLAGVSTSTVSKIMNKKDESISQETRERVLRIAKEYHYSPYSSATSLTQKTWSIGVVVSSSASLDMILDGIIKSAQKSGYYTIVCNSYSNPVQESKNIRSLCNSKVDGIIWEPIDKNSLSLCNYITEQNIPFITTGSLFQDISFQIPYEKLSYRITQELIERGHKKIACLASDGRRKELFINGYRKCLFEYQLQWDEKLIFEQITDTIIEKINEKEITGIICSHYREALDLYHTLYKLHFKIPEQVSLISLKTNHTDTVFSPVISTYTISAENFGIYLCNKIVSLIEKTKHDSTCFTQEYKLDNEITISSPYDQNKKSIVVVGSINMDTYLNVTKLPDTGKTVTSPNSSVYPGGKGINQACGAAKLGHSVSLIGNVGYDSEADHIYRTLTEHSVNTFGIKRCFQKDTGKAYIFLDSLGNSMISILTGANAFFSPQDILENEYLFENAGFCLVQTEIPIETVMQACKTAHKYNAKNILKPSACNNIPKELFPYVDILIPNEEELTDLCPAPPSLEEKCAKMISHGVKAVIVTLGDRGCYLCTNDTQQYFPAATFTPVDATGASDAFISALASYLLYGYTLSQSISLATYAAGFCISREGVVPSLIDKTSLESYISQTNPALLAIPDHNSPQ